MKTVKTTPAAKTSTKATAKKGANVKTQLAKEAAAPVKEAKEKVVRMEGDLHPTQPWFWKQIKPGVFDWRKVRTEVATTPAPEVKEAPAKAKKAATAPKAKATVKPSAKAKKTTAKK